LASQNASWLRSVSQLAFCLEKASCLQHLHFNLRNNFLGQYWFGASNFEHEGTAHFYWIDGIKVYAGFWIGIQEPSAYMSTNEAVCMYLDFDAIGAQDDYYFPVELYDTECSDNSKHFICELERKYSACIETFSNTTDPSTL
jgi:hypothetical protein